MKVTRLIREYIEEQVSKAYDSRVNPYTGLAKAQQAELHRFSEELLESQQLMLTKFHEKHKLFHSYGDFAPVKKLGASTTSVIHYYTEAMLAERKWAEENNRKKRAKIREIILNLELGATRKELDEMLANVLKGEE